ncbi:hypothetical protein BHE74_00055315 [Ensete ventricosum]|uniref:Uncharacterized protein n=1 Tax=Ensete ventricosum TaxID=4639 RepID=A0A444D7S4_ENSVE|nr:hypothetical protein GW17_00043288 [Ensete ventricosum]RWW39365.1 hypothetical protein BHE74_00055315 [Ensete ventricosum]RZR71160.1 hypothetical protein BHM03_00003927 [Ensete ventricosum]
MAQATVVESNSNSLPPGAANSGMTKKRKTPSELRVHFFRNPPFLFLHIITPWKKREDIHISLILMAMHMWQGEQLKRRNAQLTGEQVLPPLLASDR